MDVQYRPIAAADELPVGTCNAVTVDGMEIVLAHLADGYYAVENRCSHAHSRLVTGKIYRGNQIACPLHGARFDLKTGAAKSPPAFSSLVKFPVRIENGQIAVAIPRTNLPG
jgi:3-phenylpropionate/trans-cinnamate dioxygenase ferredoxin subunit